MAIVKTDTYMFDGEDYKRQVKCGRSGNFIIRFPDTVYLATGVQEVSGTTLREVENNFRDLIDTYHDAQTKKRKVILYDIQINNEISFAKGMAVEVWACVFIEAARSLADGRTLYSYKAVEKPDQFPWELKQGGNFDKGHGHGVLEAPEKNCLDWTPGAHSFFIVMHAAMEKIIDQLSKFQDQDSLVGLIESGTKLLAGGE